MLIDTHCHLDAPEFDADQVQPASLDLRLGKVAYRLKRPTLLAFAFAAGKNYSTNKSESVQCDAAIWCYNRYSKA